jgi:hypothetical protein
MAVGPAHRGLDGQMQALERDIERHFDAAQDRWQNVIEGDLEAGDRVEGHAATLRPSFAVAQFQGRNSSSLCIA